MKQSLMVDRWSWFCCRHLTCMFQLCLIFKDMPKTRQALKWYRVVLKETFLEAIKKWHFPTNIFPWNCDRFLKGALLRKCPPTTYLASQCNGWLRLRVIIFDGSLKKFVNKHFEILGRGNERNQQISLLWNNVSKGSPNFD